MLSSFVQTLQVCAATGLVRLGRVALDGSKGEGERIAPQGDELPGELARQESRLAKIREARAVLEKAARQKAADHVAKMEAAGCHPRTDSEDAVPHDTDQRNFTDPDSKIMKTSNKDFDQCGNGSAHRDSVFEAQ